MSDEHNLTDAEADKLFRQMSKAVSSSDDEALDALMTGEEPEVVENEDAQNDVVDEPEETPESNSPEEAGDDEGKEVEPKADVDPDEAPVTEDSQAEITKLKEQLEAAEQRNRDYKRNAGRVPFLQSQLTKLEKKISELASAPPSADKTKRAQKLKAALKGLEETDPHLASTLETALLDITDDLDSSHRQSSTEVYKTLQEAQHEEFLAEQFAELEGYFPRAREVFQTKQWETWVERLSPGRKAMALSPYASEVWEALQHFAADLQRSNGVPTPKAPAPESNEEAEKIKAQRAQKLNTPAPQARTPVSKKLESDMTEDELFNLYSKKIRKEIGRE